MLFAIIEVEPHLLSTGKTLYFLCDVAFATYLGASFERRLQTLILMALTARNEYLHSAAARRSFYRTTKGS